MIRSLVIGQSCVQAFLFFVFLAAPLMPWGILVPPPGIEPGPSAVRAQSPNHQTTRGFPVCKHLYASSPPVILGDNRFQELWGVELHLWPHPLHARSAPSREVSQAWPSGPWGTRACRLRPCHPVRKVLLPGSAMRRARPREGLRLARLAQRLALHCASGACPAHSHPPPPRSSLPGSWP